MLVTQRRGDKREKGDISKKAVLFSSFLGGTVLRDSSPNVDTPTVFLFAAFHFLLETANRIYIVHGCDLHQVQVWSASHVYDK